jgi:hypothetical protein
MRKRIIFLAACMAALTYLGASGARVSTIADGGPIPLCPPNGPVTKQCPCPDPFNCKTVIGAVLPVTF